MLHILHTMRLPFEQYSDIYNSTGGSITKPIVFTMLLWSNSFICNKYMNRSIGSVVVVNAYLQPNVQSVHITTKVVISNPVHGEVYFLEHYVIMFVSDLWQVGGFPVFLRFPLPIQLIATV